MLSRFLLRVERRGRDGIQVLPLLHQRLQRGGYRRPTHRHPLHRSGRRRRCICRHPQRFRDVV